MKRAGGLPNFQEKMIPAMLSSAITVNSFDPTKDLVRGEKFLSNSRFWHKITVLNVSHLPRDIVLKLVLDNMYPYDFIPVRYTIEGPNAYFFVRNCKDAIQKIAKQNLVIPNKENKDCPLVLTLVLGYTTVNFLKINVQQNILDILKLRFDPASKTLDLSDFSSDDHLEEFSSFSQPKILYFVLLLSKGMPMETLRLANNDIRILSMESLTTVKTLANLDLRNNLIETPGDLRILKTMPVTNLWLEGNPICKKFDELSYIKMVKEVCPGVKTLDGVSVSTNLGFLPFRRNFLCNMAGKDLIDQFIEHFFSMYDSENRSIMEELYHKNAMFSLTTHYIPGQLSSAVANLTGYMELSRNIKNLSDFAKTQKGSSAGRSEIIRMLNKLPRTEHDLCSFTVDLLTYSETSVTFLVTGIFREPVTTLLEVEWIRGFSRCMVLIASENGEYNIANDMLTVSNATSNQQRNAFKIVRVPTADEFVGMIAQKDEDKKSMEDTFRLLTHLNTEWTKRFLEECDYDLKRTLTFFVELYKVERIPSSAFLF